MISNFAQIILLMKGHFHCLIQRDSESQISEKDTLDALEIQVISLNFLDKTLCTT